MSVRNIIRTSMKLLDVESTAEERKAFHKKLCALEQKLKEHHIDPDKVHGGCGAHQERLSEHLVYNMTYLHLLHCETLIGTRGKRAQRKNRR